jgi:S-adenosylhomocysteine hydrolase
MVTETDPICALQAAMEGMKLLLWMKLSKMLI